MSIFLSLLLAVEQLLLPQGSVYFTASLMIIQPTSIVLHVYRYVFLITVILQDAHKLILDVLISLQMNVLNHVTGIHQVHSPNAHTCHLFNIVTHFNILNIINSP